MALLLFSGLKNKDQEKWNLEKIDNCSYFFHAEVRTLAPAIHSTSIYIIK